MFQAHAAKVAGERACEREGGRESKRARKRGRRSESERDRGDDDDDDDEEETAGVPQGSRLD